MLGFRASRKWTALPFQHIRCSSSYFNLKPNSPNYDSNDVPEQKRVLNQSSLLRDYNMFTSDTALQDNIRYYKADWAEDHLTKVGDYAGSFEMMSMARQANSNMPKFMSHDEQGRRVNFVQYHPSYHHIMSYGIENGVSSFGWTHQDKQNAQVARSALGYMMYQAESGTGCPMTMTFAAVPALRQATSEQLERCNWVEKAITPVYDPRDIAASQKKGITVGMSMTERQGGSDVRANITTATPLSSKTGKGEIYLLNGHKWFTSAPMCDAFLTLAQTPKGLSCFIVPRFIPGADVPNTGLQFQRLKEKIGDRSNASSEVEYHNAYAEMLGEEGRGVPTIIEMVQHTRLDCLVGSAALMRRCLSISLHHVSQRKAFGATLLDAPLMQNVMADLALESEAATALAFRLAATFDPKASDEENALSRVATAIGKYYICKRAPNFAYETMEALGGNGYVEEHDMAVHFRQSPLNAIWEGSGNVICLDVLRCLAKEPASIEALKSNLSQYVGWNQNYDKTLSRVMKTITDQNQLRNNVGQLALLLQIGTLKDVVSDEIAALYANTRLDASWRQDYGCLPSNSNFKFLLDRAQPQL